MPRLFRDKSRAVVGANVAALKLLWDAVQKVQRERTHPSQGICANVDYHTRFIGVNGYAAVQFLAVGWEHAVLSPQGELEAYFVRSDPKCSEWDGPNGELRHDCLTYILRRIETMLKAQEGTDA